eukprot:CAMPEP_0114558664 /NCGR_PEP_ID=MMETSP0114-20121206/10506_1 /TAXON_ID=31324 /ORGANISM="Goniomonas sp, Strain m" /LENGTH=238 /DNA_ID=CAMNT_0001744077 /DNA_START=15 /DNA_END=731 /DNA_ORIENTATION=-
MASMRAKEPQFNVDLQILVSSTNPEPSLDAETFTDGKIPPDQISALFVALLRQNNLSFADAFRTLTGSKDGTELPWMKFRTAVDTLFNDALLPDEIWGAFTYMRGHDEWLVLESEWTETLKASENHGQCIYCILSLLSVLLFNDLSVEEGFDAFDEDCVGSVERDSFVATAQNLLHTRLDKAEVEFLFDLLDLEGDGVLDFEEFVLALRCAVPVDSEATQVSSSVNLHESPFNRIDEM